MGNLEGHTFPDTNEKEVRRSIDNLKEKFEIHNQSGKSQRLDYLVTEFLKRPLNSIGGGFDDVHFSVIRALLLLQNNPTGDAFSEE